jgi:hypothetical protein
MWTAKTSDGREWAEADASLLDDVLSPWKTLERICRECDYQITEASIYCATHQILVSSDGHNLLFGRVPEWSLSDDGVHIDKCFGFIRREEPDRWVWVVTDGVEWWEVVGAVGEERMPELVR